MSPEEYPSLMGRELRAGGLVRRLEGKKWGMLEPSTWLAERRITFWEGLTPHYHRLCRVHPTHPAFASREGPASEAGKGGGTDGSGAIPAGARGGIPEQTAGGESGRSGDLPSGAGDSAIK